MKNHLFHSRKMFRLKIIAPKVIKNEHISCKPPVILHYLTPIVHISYNIGGINVIFFHFLLCVIKNNCRRFVDHPNQLIVRMQ